VHGIGSDTNRAAELPRVERRERMVPAHIEALILNVFSKF